MNFFKNLLIKFLIKTFLIIFFIGGYTLAEDGINLDSDCLIHGQCSMDTYELLNIRDGEEANPTGFVNDIITGATMFIGVLVTITLVVSGFLFILAGGDEKMAERGKSGAKYSLIGLLLVIFSYTIIRAIQFLAAG
ncbi:pilin [Candidatus Absconditicoccus praedator]|uniref:pilin n=1 Tax=Candidatus Absconditicoccus praedator TaxID=2735562 RepID=UPI001E422E02|nr:pilin [Candidatus Absconditicoccus praedator]UFX83249.1 hypothetical protein HLG78_03920 [Candidatus Absconditicoccus praedator]